MNVTADIGTTYRPNYHVRLLFIFMPPTLKKLMGHIAFGVCVRGCFTFFVPTVTFKPLKLES